MRRDNRLERDTTRSQVLAAARAAFRAGPARKVTVDTVARDAEVSRQTFYRYFPGRIALVEAVAAERIGELADDIVAGGWDEQEPDLVFVDRCSAVVASVRDDPELRHLLDDGPVTLHDVLWQPEVWLRGLSDWTTWLRRARGEGLIAAELTDEDIYDWLQTVLISIILQPSVDERRARRQLTLLLRSLRPQREPAAVRSDEP